MLAEVRRRLYSHHSRSEEGDKREALPYSHSQWGYHAKGKNYQPKISQDVKDADVQLQ